MRIARRACVTPSALVNILIGDASPRTEADRMTITEGTAREPARAKQQHGGVVLRLDRAAVISLKVIPEQRNAQHVIPGSAVAHAAVGIAG